LFHVVTIFGPFRVPVVVCILILITVSVATGFSEASSASTDSKNSMYMCTLFHSNNWHTRHQLFSWCAVCDVIMSVVNVTTATHLSRRQLLNEWKGYKIVGFEMVFETL